MSRWFRHYAGMVRDDKLVRASIKSKQSIERVVWIWGAVLESAAEIDDEGRYEVEPEEIARFLRCKASAVEAVLSALRDLDRMDDETVSAWSRRQFTSDRSNARVAKHRASKRASGNDDVTLQERPGNSPETETETETEVDDGGDARETRAAAEIIAVDWDAIRLTDELCRIAGVRHVDPGPISRHQAIVREWIAEGLDPNTEIIPAIRQAVTDSTERITSLAYFANPVRQFRARKEAHSHGHEPSRPASRRGEPELSPLVGASARYAARHAAG